MVGKTLILQGGGFRTAFTAGVLDAFRTHHYNPFDGYVAVSGGAIALSYYLSDQYRCYYDALCLLAEDKHFMSWNRLISPMGVMNVDYFRTVAEEIIPFDIDKALETVEGKEMAIVLTNRSNGAAHYYHPDRKHWIDAIIATCTLPFVTKGSHMLHGEDFMDGGWSDPLPVKWAFDHGARDIVIVRTSPSELKLEQTWSDYFGTYIYSSQGKLKACFEENHLKYNDSVDFMNNPPEDLNLIQIAPEAPLQTGTYSNNVKLITADYRHGLDCGLRYLLRNSNV
ncbi:MAG: patatin family protein [Crocinitomicaceae bacterium]|nr:patatin family protein [Crocinitomicaceae bacterium]